MLRVKQREGKTSGIGILIFLFSLSFSKGMVDPGEKISAALKREFGEEALNSLQKSPEDKAKLEKQLHKLFSQEHFVVSSVSLVIAS